MIFDLHTDLPTYAVSEKEKFRFLEDNRSSVITLAVWTSELADPLAEIKNTVKTYLRFGNARFAVEDSWFVNKENISEIVSLPLIYCTLAWSVDNAVAGGHIGTGGLTALGKEFITSLNGAGIAVDTAHLNERSFYEALEAGAKVLCSHTCLFSEFPHTRNLKDEQVSALIKAGGIVGIAAVSDFMGKKRARMCDYAAQFRAYAEKFGVGSLSVGTDFFGTEPIEGLETYDKIGSLAEELIKSGFSEKDVRDIFFDNANKFFTT